MMYVLEWFRGKNIMDSLFAFSPEELRNNKVKLIKQCSKDDTIYISKMNADYDKEVVVSKITKITK